MLAFLQTGAAALSAPSSLNVNAPPMALSVPPPPVACASPVHLRCVHFNDVYSLEHLPKLKTLLHDVAGSAPEATTICTLGGDFFSPSVLSSIDGGESMVECLSQLPVDFACLGNHEADVNQDAFVHNVNRFSGTVINSNWPTMPACGKAMPPFEILEISSADGAHTRRVGLLGLLCTHQSLYLPSAFCDGAQADATPVLESARSLIPTLRDTHNCSMIIPLTHQDVADDVRLAEAIGCEQHVPLVLGGHDHEVHDVARADGRCRVLKAGRDAQSAFVVDVWWEDAHALPRLQYSLVDVAGMDAWRAEPSLAALVSRHHAQLQRLDRTVLRAIEQRSLGLSSVGVRSHQTTIGALVCTALRKGLRADAAVLNAGAIRGNAQYTRCFVSEGGGASQRTRWGEQRRREQRVRPHEERERAAADEDGCAVDGDERPLFTFADLTRELPYDTPIVVVPLPGRVLEEAIHASRTHARASTSGNAADAAESGASDERAAFLQLDNELIVWAETDPSTRQKRWRVRSVHGEPFDPDRTYRVACLYHALLGLDAIAPLMDWSAGHPELLPPVDAARPAKNLVLQVCFREIWTHLGTLTRSTRTERTTSHGTSCARRSRRALASSRPMSSSTTRCGPSIAIRTAA